MPPRNKLTWESHKQRWDQCTLCEACDRRKNVVLLRGTYPCDVLFVGEAPGLSEDSLAKPFIGPAGKELDKLIDQASEGIEGLELSFTNIVACLPDRNEKGKLTDPSVAEIEACRPRLLEVIGLCQPKLIVAVGKLAGKHLRYEGEARVIEVLHPSAVLQAEDSMKPLMYKRIVVALRDAFVDLIC